MGQVSLENGVVTRLQMGFRTNFGLGDSSILQADLSPSSEELLNSQIQPKIHNNNNKFFIQNLYNNHS